MYYGVCIGYYLIERMPKPDWCSLRQKKLLSIGGGVSRKHPDLSGCFWVNYPERQRQAYRERLQLSQEQFADFAEDVADLFGKRMTSDCRFQYFGDAYRIYQTVKNAGDIHLVAVCTANAYAMELDKIGFFRKIGLSQLHPGGVLLGSEILGCEGFLPAEGDTSFGESFWFDSYLEDGLETVLSRHARLELDDAYGLLQNNYGEVMAFANAIQGMGEPVTWMPYQIFGY